MKYTVYDRLLKREVGHQRRTYTDIRGIYGDRHWVDDFDIVNELEGHNGCVNALRYVATDLELQKVLTSFCQLVAIWPSSRLGLRRPPHQHPLI
jgi:hypothetical protein